MAGSYSVSTFRTLGNAAATQNLFSIQNAAASGLVVLVRHLEYFLEMTTVLTAVGSVVKLSRPAALPTGGTTLTPVKRDMLITGNLPAGIVCRGATAADGGAATAITATAGAQFRSVPAPRLHTAVGQVFHLPNLLLPPWAQTDPLRLRPGEAALVQVVQPTAANNPATNHWLVNCDFDVEAE